MLNVINQAVKISDLESVSNLESGDLMVVAEKNNTSYLTKKIDASYINNLRTIASNLGTTGAQVYEGAIGGQTSPLALRFRRIVAGADIAVSQTDDSITIAAPDALKVASNAEVWSGTVTNKAVSPAGLASKMSSDNAGDYIVKRDYYGNFAANAITASLNGNAATASQLQTQRSINLSGDVLGSATTNFSGNVNIVTTVKPGVGNNRAWAQVPGCVDSNNTTTDLPGVNDEAYSITAQSYSIINDGTSFGGGTNLQIVSVTSPNHPFKVGNIFYARYASNNLFGDDMYMVTSVSTNSFICYAVKRSNAFTPGVNNGNYFTIYLNNHSAGNNISCVCSPWGAKNVYTNGYNGENIYGEYYINFNTPVVAPSVATFTSLNHGYVPAILPVLLALPPSEIDINQLTNDTSVNWSSSSSTPHLIGVNNTYHRMFRHNDYGQIRRIQLGSSTGPVYTLRYGDIVFVAKGASDIVGGAAGIINSFMLPGCVRVKFFDQRIYAPHPAIAGSDLTPDYAKGFNMIVL